ncbi:PASTA domain-containing protein [Streptomyces sp. NPDC001315]|uniref:PASTA domain-containing protein n=1 Tax=Streptomyces sp. NPDC001315 TaxID=3364562 RepID=UPI0036C0DCE3
MPQVPQVRRILFNDEEIGMGFNSESGLAVGTALDSFTIAENPTAPGAEVTSSISIINTHEELQENLGMSFEAQGRYGFFSASTKTKFSESTKFNSTSTFLVARCLVENSMRRGKNFKVTGEAKALLDANRTDEFSRAFGDSFIRGLQTGGEFYAVIRITSVSTSKQSELAATLQAEANGLVASGSFKAAFTEANGSESTRSEFSATMYQKAGTGTQISPTVSIEDVIQRYRQFPEIARANAAAYETEVATYDTLPLPLPTPEEREDFLLALADAREKKLNYIQARNDLEFALKNPMFFRDLPSSETLNGAISDYTKLINAVMAHAIALSRGQITPPQLFDPGSLSPPLTEPGPITLNRVQTAPPPPQVKVPACIDMPVTAVHIKLRQLGLIVRDSAPLEITQDGHLLKGQIVNQSPPAGTMVDVGTEIELVIGNYYEQGPYRRIGRIPN